MSVAQVVDDEHLIVEGGYPFTTEDMGFEIQILRYVDDRAQDIREKLDAYAGYGRPPLDWEPSPDEGEIENSRILLNQWMRHTFAEIADTPMARPPLFDTLPEAMRKSARLADYISLDALADVAFEDHEGRLIQQAVWMRNISNWARGDAVGDVELAKKLFDWTVRHIQLEDSVQEHHLAREPWEVLLYGSGAAQQRGWVFVHLCRQQGLPAVLLAAPRSDAGDEPTPQFWCAAVASEGRLYLFDPSLGLPLPGAEGQGVATLSEAASRPEVLRQLDLDDEHRYGWTHQDVQHVQAMIVASPFSLSRRARLLQERLVGQTGFVIADDPALLAKTLSGHEHVHNVVLWSWPLETLDRQLAMGLEQNQRQRVRAALEFRVFAFEPHLWKARALHFHGPATSSREGRGESGVEAVEGHQEAISLYQTALASRQAFAREQSDEKRQTMQTARENAMYWLGLLKVDQGLTKQNMSDLEIASTSWFAQILAAKSPSSWRNGTRYNLARVYEEMGRTDDAIELYDQDDSPQWHGNRLRARWLREGKSLGTQPAAS